MEHLGPKPWVFRLAVFEFGRVGDAEQFAIPPALSCRELVFFWIDENLKDHVVDLRIAGLRKMQLFAGPGLAVVGSFGKRTRR